MTVRVLRYPLGVFEPGETTLALPWVRGFLHFGAKIPPTAVLGLGELPPLEPPELNVWVAADPDSPPHLYRFLLTWTGGELPERLAQMGPKTYHIGTCMTPYRGEMLVWHLFELGSERIPFEVGIGEADL